MLSRSTLFHYRCRTVLGLSQARLSRFSFLLLIAMALPPVLGAERMRARVPAYGKTPVVFVTASGRQPETLFAARGLGYALSLSADGTLSQLGGPGLNEVRQRLVGANPSPAVEAKGPMPGRYSHYFGADPAGWVVGAGGYSRIEYRQVYPGVDLVYHGNQTELEYDFVVAPGADPASIAVDFDGVTGLRIGEDGELRLEIPGGGELVQRRPVAYQRFGAVVSPVEVGYRVLDGRRVGFSIGDYEATRELVIDPTLVYSTYLGLGGEDSAEAVAVDSVGNAYVVGSFINAVGETADACVYKLNPGGTAILFSTCVGGSLYDIPRSVALDDSGNVYFGGRTNSTDFPVTIPTPSSAVSPIREKKRKTPPPPPPPPSNYGGGQTDGFIVKLDPSGNLVWARYLGGNVDEPDGAVITVDGAGLVHATGRTSSTNFPVTDGSTLTGGTDMFAVKLSANGQTLLYSRYIGGSDIERDLAIALDSGGKAYITGTTRSTDFPVTNGSSLTGTVDVFLTQLASSGATVYSSYMGIPGSTRGLTLDDSGNVYLAGETSSTSLPVTANAAQSTLAGSNDLFVIRLSPTFNVTYGSYLGGSGAEYGGRVEVDASGDIYLSASTFSTDFPVTPDALQSAKLGTFDTVVAHLSSGGALVFATYFGGPGSGFSDFNRGLAVDSGGGIYITGYTSSTAFPVTPGAVQPTFAGGPLDGYVASIQ